MVASDVHLMARWSWVS